jgi:hypothetical protein
MSTKYEFPDFIYFNNITCDTCRYACIKSCVFIDEPLESCNTCQENNGHLPNSWFDDISIKYVNDVPKIEIDQSKLHHYYCYNNEICKCVPCNKTWKNGKLVNNYLHATS